MMNWKNGLIAFKVKQKIRCLYSCRQEVKSGSYKDQTGNLRSSIGYIIAKDGEVVTENFKEGDKGTDKTTGKYKGRRLAEEVSLSYTGGYVLVGVAGMEYAAAVEAKGYEVVSGANTQCEKYLRDTLKSIFSKI